MNSSHLTEVLTQATDRSRVERALQHADWVVYGAGNAGRAWAAALQAQGKRVHAFIDRNADGRSVDGLPVYPLATCPDNLHQRCAVLLALHNPGVDVASVRRSVQAAGFHTVWLLQDVIDALPQLAHFWLAPASESLTHVEALTTAYGLLADAPSRALFVALLDQRLNGRAEALPPPDPVHQYVPPDLPPPPQPLRYIDCGAYTGDTLRSFRQLGYRFAHVAAFEPDPAHYPALARTLATEQAAIFPCGAWHQRAQLHFTTSDAASHITDTGATTIQVVALDEALPHFAPNFIKMDIEGAEAQALHGAQAMLRQHRPRLAISAYHRPRDLWELLQHIHTLALGYSFYLRSHAYNGFDTVLYALPEP